MSHLKLKKKSLASVTKFTDNGKTVIVVEGAEYTILKGNQSVGSLSVDKFGYLNLSWQIPAEQLPIEDVVSFLGKEFTEVLGRLNIAEPQPEEKSEGV